MLTTLHWLAPGPFQMALCIRLACRLSSGLLVSIFKQVVYGLGLEHVVRVSLVRIVLVSVTFLLDESATTITVYEGSILGCCVALTCPRSFMGAAERPDGLSMGPTTRVRW